jgi:hypothetical protein
VPSDYPTCAGTYATLRVYSESLDPSEMTNRLGIEPTDWQRHGEEWQSGSQPAALHCWFLSSKGKVASSDVRQHLDWLLGIVVPRADAVRSLQSNGCRMDVFCFWVSASGHGGPSVRPTQMRELAELGLELSFDVYFANGRDADRPGPTERAPNEVS